MAPINRKKRVRVLGQIQWQGKGGSSYTAGKVGNHPLQAEADTEEQSPLLGMPFLLLPLETIIALVTRGSISGTLNNVPGAVKSSFHVCSHQVPTTAQHGGHSNLTTLPSSICFSLRAEAELSRLPQPKTLSRHLTHTCSLAVSLARATSWANSLHWSL